VSRSRQLSPLPDDLPLAVRTLLGELRLLKDRSGYDLRALASKTHASRSSWGRWLSGETWIPREAVASMAELCAGDSSRLNALWQRAEDERQARQFAVPEAADASERNVPDTADTAGTTASATGPDTSTPGGTATAVRPRNTTGPSAVIDPERPSGGLRRMRPRWSQTVVTGIIVACAVVTGAAGLTIGLSLRKAPAQPANPFTQWLTRREIVSRVQTWHPHTAQRIPYSQTGSYGGYRTDGSGYASMAIGLPSPGRTSGELASGQYSRRIAPTELQPGDLIINPTGDAGTRQVAIFDAWADGTHTRYWVYQQRRGYGTDHLVLSYALGSNSPYHAFRPLNIHETNAPRPAT
jgi:hypothetical protein